MCSIEGCDHSRKTRIGLNGSVAWWWQLEKPLCPHHAHEKYPKRNIESRFLTQCGKTKGRFSSSLRSTF